MCETTHLMDELESRKGEIRWADGRNKIEYCEITLLTTLDDLTSLKQY